MNNTNKEVIIEQLVATGLTVEEAENQYNKLFNQGSGVKLPYPLIKVNNVVGVAEMSQLVAVPIKDDDGETVGYEKVFNFSDIDFTIITKKAMWQLRNQDDGRVVVKTKYQDVMVPAARFIDEISGKTVAELKDTPMQPQYQILAIVGVRPRGSKEPFELFSMYLKTTVLYGFNRLFDTYKNDSPYSVARVATKIGKKGAVRYTEIDLEASEVEPFTQEDTLTNLTNMLEAVNKFEAYVEAYNDQVSKGGASATQAEGLPA